MNIQAELADLIAYLKQLEGARLVGTEPGDKDREIARVRADISELEASIAAVNRAG